MNVAQLMGSLELDLLTPETDLTREVTGGCVCDLLSFVMARGEAGMAWITVQTHLVIVAEGCAVEPETLAKAAEEGIPVLRSALSEYILSGRLYALGVR